MTSSTELPATGVDPSPRLRSRHLGHVASFAYSYAIVWVLLVEIVVFSALRPGTFFTSTNADSILSSQAFLLLIAVGLTVPLAAGEFDLSVGAIAGFSEILFGTLTVSANWSFWPAVAVSIGACAAVGAINGLVVVRLGVGAFIMTLGMGTVATGVGLELSAGGIISGLPHELTTISASSFLGLQLSFWYALAITIVVWYLLAHTPLGRWVYFTGSNPEMARLNGLPTGLIRAASLTVSATLAGIAGILYAGSLGTADSNSASEFLLTAFAAAFLGATSIRPGRFNAWGTFCAVYLIETGVVGLTLLTGAADWITYVFNGAILIVAVVAQRAVAGRRAASQSYA